ncbi:MAG: hypothetical protein ABIN04_08490 [Ginsengibacter sp.]
MTFPKVLIIGQPFNKKSGGGITISNLFKGWPKDKIAVASNQNLKNDIDFSVCEIYYQLGYNNKLHPFPLNIFLPKIECGLIKTQSNNNGNAIQNLQKTKKKKNFKSIYLLSNKFLKFFGIYNFFYKLKITDEFKEWLHRYEPDIIYSQLSTLELIRFVNEIKLLTNKSLIIHIMDDWPAKIGQPGIFHSYWKNRTNKEFRNLLDKSSPLMSICEAMSEEYKIRYNKDFIPFHNPIETDSWLPFSRNQWVVGEKLTILYAGRIGKGITNSIVEMGIVVNDLYQSGTNIQFEIQSPDNDQLAHLLDYNNCIKFLNPIEYSGLPQKFSSVDLLFLPEDFDEDSVEFLKFSIQTKVAEYMISGTHILVFADKRTALAKYALKDNWAYVVTENKRSTLTKALHELMTDQELRKQLSVRAKEIAIKNENAETVRNNFRKVLFEL